MTAIFLFCTANVPASTVNRFMTEFSETSEGPNFFSLVRHPDQSSFDEWGTELPVGDFTTGFREATDAQLRLYANNKIAALRQTGAEGGLEPEWIAKLDERSQYDSTVVLQYCMPKSTWIQSLEDAELEFHVPGQADIAEASDEIWWTWRVGFADAFWLFNGVDDGDVDMILLYTRPEFLDPDGVLHVDVPRGIIQGDIPDAITESRS
ncbi:hypothetical protein BO94DRAFT_534778 [Aspergillus sclerotioniger CBS 115572]|uniref:Uncharacterized protein n=1 Tax=Aspergillus sclerotioniger CBS 115572 TaxID=1450535 RepID=A0A317WUN6_9EURO|nr:hypothetical protein BO94DRAFT_534778 [Aspergillus sclerotioniger CBS 115572]PWY88907.1 hypothetical protein BO94DRAFT_534778 [Aspergillus sclerotioniger CBS 115572]